MRIPKQTNDFPMKFFRYLKLFILTSIFFGTCSHVFADYMSRMKERLPSLIDAKDQGIVGEGTDGFVYVRSGDSEKSPNWSPAKMQIVKSCFSRWP